MADQINETGQSVGRGDWQRPFVQFVRETTGCTYEQAFMVMGQVCEIRQTEYQFGYGRGYNSGFADGLARAERQQQRGSGQIPWPQEREDMDDYITRVMLSKPLLDMTIGQFESEFDRACAAAGYTQEELIGWAEGFATFLHDNPTFEVDPERLNVMNRNRRHG